MSLVDSSLISHLLEREDPCCTNSKNTSRDNEVSPILSHTILMQEPTEEAEEVEAPIPTEIASMSNGPNLRRKAANRTLPWQQES
jgi:hypothetical protein